MSRTGLIKRLDFGTSPAVAQAAAWAQDYVAARELRISGAVVPAGAPIDKTHLSPRKVLQMYQSRQIKLAAGAEKKLAAAPRVKRPPAIGPTDLRNPGSCGHELIERRPAKKAPIRVASKRSTPRAKSKRAA